MAYLFLLPLVLKRLRIRWMLSALSLVGIALTIGLVTSIPVFTDSVGFGILQKELAEFAFGNLSPPLALRYYRVPNAPTVMSVQQALDTGVWLAQLTEREVGVPVDRAYIQIGSHALTMRALPDDERYQQRELRQVRINAVPGVSDQIRVMEGQPFSAADDSPELLVWGRQAFLDQLGVRVGEQFELFNYNAVRPDQPLRFRIAGSWEAVDPLGPFWYRDPHDLLADEFLTSLNAFARFVAPIMPQQVDFTYWYFVLDENRLRFDEVDRYTRGLAIAQGKAESMIPSIRVDRSPVEPLLKVQSRTRVLKELLYGFSLPIVALLLFFIATISAITVRYQRHENAILVSRGASASQVLLISLIEGSVLIIVGLPLGLLACNHLALVMGRNSSFLSFDRAPLALAVHSLDWRMVVIALVISLLARLLPTLRGANRTIVTHGRQRARALGNGLALRALLLVMLTAITAYAYWQLDQRGIMAPISWEASGGVRRDPLLYLAPALFILTCGWVLAELFPLLMRLPDTLGRLLPGVSVYIGLHNLARDSGAYTAPLFLLILCLCLGSFEASIARSADTWLVDRLRYQVGADYRFAHAVITDGPEAGIGQDAWLMPVSEYEKLPGVLRATRIGSYTAIPTIDGMSRMELMGIDRLDFPQVAYWRDDYAGEALGSLLNKMASQIDGVLVTRRFLDRTSLFLGDRLILEVIVEEGVMPIPFVIMGVFDHFPTMYETRGSLAVANLDYLFDQIGRTEPHTIWLRTEADLDAMELSEALKQLRVVTRAEQNTWELIAKDRARLERVGIFGNLTVGFLAGSLVAWLGLLIYTFASLTGRLRSFAVLRALGLNIKQVLAIVSVEYLLVILYGIVGGAMAGIATSQLFVPFFQFTEDPAVQVPPFVPEIAAEQLAWIISVYVSVLIIAEAVVLVRATRREAFQTLRLGDEE
jgi:putative ABC transport system permease protein